MPINYPKLLVSPDGLNEEQELSPAANAFDIFPNDVSGYAVYNMLADELSPCWEDHYVGDAEGKLSDGRLAEDANRDFVASTVKECIDHLTLWLARFDAVTRIPTLMDKAQDLAFEGKGDSGSDIRNQVREMTKRTGWDDNKLKGSGKTLAQIRAMNADLMLDDNTDTEKE